MMYKVCAYCGWISKAYPNDTLLAGPGGQLSCLECAEDSRCRNIKAYGMVNIFDDKDFMRILASKNRLATIRRIVDETYSLRGSILKKGGGKNGKNRC